MQSCKISRVLSGRHADLAIRRSTNCRTTRGAALRQVILSWPPGCTTTLARRASAGRRKTSMSLSVTPQIRYLVGCGLKYKHTEEHRLREKCYHYFPTIRHP